MRSREIEYKGYTIVQTIEYKRNNADGDGNELKTTIKEIYYIPSFAQMIWLNKEQQNRKVEDEISKAKYAIDLAQKEKEPDLFDELGFK